VCAEGEVWRGEDCECFYENGYYGVVAREVGVELVSGLVVLVEVYQLVSMG